MVVHDICLSSIPSFAYKGHIIPALSRKGIVYQQCRVLKPKVRNVIVRDAKTGEVKRISTKVFKRSKKTGKCTKVYDKTTGKQKIVMQARRVEQVAATTTAFLSFATQHDAGVAFEKLTSGSRFAIGNAIVGVSWARGRTTKFTAADVRTFVAKQGVVRKPKQGAARFVLDDAAAFPVLGAQPIRKAAAPTPTPTPTPKPKPKPKRRKRGAAKRKAASAAAAALAAEKTATAKKVKKTTAVPYSAAPQWAHAVLQCVVEVSVCTELPSSSCCMPPAMPKAFLPPQLKLQCKPMLRRTQTA
jgi:hypothetical protein